MLHELRGDLLLSRADVLAHGVAPGDHFDSGLAKALRERFPALYKDFRHYCRQRSPRPGELWLWRGVDGDGRAVRVASLFTQPPAEQPGGHPGRAETSHVNRALHALKKLVVDDGFGSVALPRLATGVGGLAWEHVEPLIRAQLGELDAHVAVYADYAPGVAADEPFARPAP